MKHIPRLSGGPLGVVRGKCLLILLAAIVACGEQNRIATEFTAAADRVATAADDSSAGLAPVVPPAVSVLPSAPAAIDSVPPPPPVSSTLTPYAGFTLRGSARLSAVGGQTAIDAALWGGVAYGTYQGAIRLGACPRPGPSLGSVVGVSTDSAGRGRAHTFLPITLDSLTSAGAVLVYGNGGRPETCGAISQRAGTPPAERLQDPMSVQVLQLE